MNKEARIQSKNENQSADAMLQEIRELSFVKTELELYLDTHPNCHTALDYYHRTTDALNDLMMKYQSMVGPLRAEGVVSNDNWTWVNTPWPWQVGNGGK